MGWEGRLHRYPYPSVSRLAIYTDRHFIVASHRSYFPDFCSINISYDTSDLVEPDNEYVGIVCFNRYVKEPAGCNSTSKGNAFNVRKFELAILLPSPCSVIADSV